MKRILVAVDGSPGALEAARFAEDLFAGLDVAFTAVNVASVPVHPVAPVPFGGLYAWPHAGVTSAYGPIEEEVRREDAAAEAVAVEQAPEGADIAVLHGNVVDAITGAADELGADLIVVGHSDRGLLARLLTGSVSKEVVRAADRPVLVV